MFIKLMTPSMTVFLSRTKKIIQDILGEVYKHVYKWVDIRNI